MIDRNRATGLLVAAALASGCGVAPQPPMPPAYGSGGAPQLFEGMGAHTRTVTTSSPEAQVYFDQGLNWIYSFNHDEAVRSFTKAAEIDPGCAMAYWGISYAQGPNYNDPMMSPDRSIAAWTTLQAALAAIDEETPSERALIEALTHRYSATPTEDRSDLDQAFADAMSQVWADHPDADVGTLYAESVMTLNPWKLYDDDGTPARDETLQVVKVLEEVLAMAPNNPGANHLYIHAVEPSLDKDRGIAAADRLSHLVPGSGHLRHMPSHIYVQVGMWDRSIDQNALAMAEDRKYRTLAPEQGIQNGYMVHNSHMLAFSAMMVGREAEAMDAAKAMWDDLPEEALRNYGPYFDAVMCSVYDVEKRFGRWDDILAEPQPPEFLPATTALWRAHRAIAFAAKKDFASADREHELFRELKEELPPQPGWAEYEVARKFLDVSDLFIEGEIALQQDQWDDAISLLEQAAALEDELGYGEPPMYMQPVRHTLGAVYLKRGRYSDAERAFREDLSQWRSNGWSLYGLARALEEQGKTAEAAAVRADFDTVWARADEPLDTSCKCLPKI